MSMSIRLLGLSTAALLMSACATPASPPSAGACNAASTPGAVRAAIEHPLMLGAMADHLASTMRTCGRQHVDGAFEGVEGVTCAVGTGDGECLVVIVAAHCASGHRVFLEGDFEDAARGGHVR